VLPHLEQQALYNSWNSCGINAAGAPENMDLDLRYFGVTNRTVTSTWLNTYLCPSDQTNAPISATMNGLTYACTSQNYAGNFGNSIVQQIDFQDIQFGGAPFVDIGSPEGDYNQPGRRTVGFSAIRDGMSGTLLVSEVIVGQGQDLRGFSWWGDAATFEAFASPNGSFPDVMFSPFYCINQAPNPPCTGATTALPNMYAARSRHPSGVNAAMCDGSVHFIKNSVNLRTWRALSTTQGNEVTSADQY
jgi:prepilin-type processing-associated H-X9-DG protein